MIYKHKKYKFKINKDINVFYFFLKLFKNTKTNNI